MHQFWPRVTRGGWEGGRKGRVGMGREVAKAAR